MSNGTKVFIDEYKGHKLFTIWNVGQSPPLKEEACEVTHR